MFKPGTICGIKNIISHSNFNKIVSTKNFLEHLLFVSAEIQYETKILPDGVLRKKIVQILQ